MKSTDLATLIRPVDWDNDLLPITREKCLLFKGDDRFEAMANHLARHYSRPDRESSWARSLEASRWKENFVSAFFDVKSRKDAPDWWLMLGESSDEMIGIHVVCVSPPIEPSKTSDVIGLLDQINTAIGKMVAPTPGTPKDEVVRRVNQQIKQAVHSPGA